MSVFGGERGNFMQVKSLKLLGLVVIMIFALSAVGMVHAVPKLAVSSKITAVTAGAGMAYDPTKGEIFVLDKSGTVTAISDSTNKVVATVSIPNGYGYYNGMAYDSGQGEIFVASGNAISGGTPMITVISDSSNGIVANITSGSWWFPYGVAYDSSKGEIFVTDAGNGQNVLGNVYVVSDSTNTEVQSIGVGYFPEAIAYDSGRGEIFVANSGSR